MSRRRFPGANSLLFAAFLLAPPLVPARTTATERAAAVWELPG